MHDRLLATPLIIQPHMSDAEIEYEFQRMAFRSLMLNEFLAGGIDLDQLYDAFNENGVNPHKFEQDKDNNLYYL